MAKDSHLLTDIRLRLTHSELRPVYEVETERRRVPTKPERRGAPDKPGSFLDMSMVEGRKNLGQAVILRLLTPRGELTPLGHPEYGSRLYELIGRENTATTRNLAKLFILESLKAEPRIEKVTFLSVDPDQVRRDRVIVALQVKPVGITATVTIGPFTLELQQ